MARHQALVLSGGNDARLLNTRNAVLKQAGYHVVSAFSSLELLEKFFSGDYDVVVLCHSVPEQEQEKLAQAIHRYSPSTPVATIVLNGQSRPFADAHIPNDPLMLVQCLPDLLRRMSKTG